MVENEGPSDKKEVEQRQREALRLEYQECCTLSRFLQGIRLTFFASFITLLAVLVGGYHYIWSAPEDKFGKLRPFLLVVVSFFGVLVSVCAGVVEMRNVVLGDKCDRRSAELEKKMQIEGGIYQRIVEWATHDVRIPLTQTPTIDFLYFVVLHVWVLLFVYSGYRLFWR